MKRTQGRVSIAQVVLWAVFAAAAYGGFMYLPLLLHKLAIGDVARTAAAKMLVEHNDMKIRTLIYDTALRDAGIQVGPSEMFLERAVNPRVNTVTIRWTEQVKHVWGKTHVIKMEVAESVGTDGVKVLKNAE